MHEPVFEAPEIQPIKIAMIAISPAPLKVKLPIVIVAVVFSPSVCATMVTGMPTLAGSREAMICPIIVYTSPCFLMESIEKLELTSR